MFVKMFAAALSFTLLLTFSECGSAEIVTGPILEFYPQPSEDSNGRDLIWYKDIRGNTYEKWTRKLDEFLAGYRTPGLIPGRGQIVEHCDYDHFPQPGKVCNEDIKTWAPCTKENHYDYPNYNPCVFLRLSQVPGWVPDFYRANDTLPEYMPQDLQQHIQSLNASDPKKLNTVWVSCDGASPVDRENVGNIEHLPSYRRGFPGFFFPFNHTEGYLGPIVAVHFQRPTKGIVIAVECKAWAKNIIQDGEKPSGSVVFELLLD